MKEGNGAGVYGHSVRRRLRFSLGRYATAFHADIYAVLACVYKVQFHSRPDKYVTIWSDSQGALKALQAIRTTSPLFLQCHKTLNDISSRHGVRLYWVPGHAGLRGNEIADELARDGYALNTLRTGAFKLFKCTFPGSKQFKSTFILCFFKYL